MMRANEGASANGFYLLGAAINDLDQSVVVGLKCKQ